MLKRLIRLCVIMVFSIETIVGAKENYSPTAATRYASRYATKYNNELYTSYSNDCTNYVSQCVRAGGIKIVRIPDKNVDIFDVDGMYKTKDYWNLEYYTNYLFGHPINSGWVATSTWIRVDEKDNKGFYGFQDYMCHKKSKTTLEYTCSDDGVKNLINDAKIGDVIQLKEKGDARCHHSMLIGDKKKTIWLKTNQWI
ncbi:amidase domain-containing protein [Eubacterium sp.]|uniref:amidase domain-containing protein n=1 Tax=Eubacterium sp. TaxID=142586 RepID=UPI0025F38E50|nr:amidase domain-containing protein [Eubacterium sp.]MCR5629629.1 amidase domain-containing protein [Eubacterium sp.]